MSLEKPNYHLFCFLFIVVQLAACGEQDIEKRDENIIEPEKELVAIDSILFEVGESVELNLDINFEAYLYYNYSERWLSDYMEVVNSSTESQISIWFKGIDWYDPCCGPPPDDWYSRYNLGFENAVNKSYDLTILVNDSLVSSGNIIVNQESIEIEWKNDGQVRFVGKDLINRIPNGVVFGSFVFLNAPWEDYKEVSETTFQSSINRLINGLLKIGFTEVHLKAGDYTYFTVNNDSSISLTSRAMSFNTAYNPENSFVKNYYPLYFMYELGELPRTRLDSLTERFPKDFALGLFRLGDQFDNYSKTSGY